MGQCLSRPTLEDEVDNDNDSVKVQVKFETGIETLDEFLKRQEYWNLTSKKWTSIHQLPPPGASASDEREEKLTPAVDQQDGETCASYSTGKATFSIIKGFNIETVDGMQQKIIDELIKIFQPNKTPIYIQDFHSAIPRTEFKEKAVAIRIEEKDHRIGFIIQAQTEDEVRENGPFLEGDQRDMDMYHLRIIAVYQKDNMEQPHAVYVKKVEGDKDQGFTLTCINSWADHYKSLVPLVTGKDSIELYYVSIYELQQ